MRAIKSLIIKFCKKLRYTILKNTLVSEHTMLEGLKRMQEKKINPLTIIDVGAAQGRWTNLALSLWPHANYILIEPLEEQQENLETLKKNYSNVDYYLAVAGQEDGETNLNVSPDLDGSGIYDTGGNNSRKVKVVAIDKIIKDHEGPYLIKLDTHGYELPILKGAEKTLKDTQLIVIEVYGFYISPTCLLFHELTAYLDQVGFRLADIVDVNRRASDNIFWQADAFYLRKENKVFEENNYN